MKSTNNFRSLSLILIVLEIHLISGMFLHNSNYKGRYMNADTGTDDEKFIDDFDYKKKTPRTLILLPKSPYKGTTEINWPTFTYYRKPPDKYSGDFLFDDNKANMKIFKKINTKHYDIDLTTQRILSDFFGNQRTSEFERTRNKNQSPKDDDEFQLFPSMKRTKAKHNKNKFNENDMEQQIDNLINLLPRLQETQNKLRRKDYLTTSEYNHILKLNNLIDAINDLEQYRGKLKNIKDVKSTLGYSRMLKQANNKINKRAKNSFEQNQTTTSTSTEPEPDEDLDDDNRQFSGNDRLTGIKNHRSTKFNLIKLANDDTPSKFIPIANISLDETMSEAENQKKIVEEVVAPLILEKLNGGNLAEEKLAKDQKNQKEHLMHYMFTTELNGLLNDNGKIKDDTNDNIEGYGSGCHTNYKCHANGVSNAYNSTNGDNFDDTGINGNNGNNGNDGNVASSGSSGCRTNYGCSGSTGGSDYMGSPSDNSTEIPQRVHMKCGQVIEMDFVQD